MSMTPRERIMAVLNGEEPDKIPVFAYYGHQLAMANPGGWFRRLAKRGLGKMDATSFYTPRAEGTIQYLPEVKYTQIHYMENGLKKYRHTFETPVGHITGVKAFNPLSVIVYVWHTEEAFVKQPSDWRVVNFISKLVLDKLAPTYKAVELKQDEVGDSGIVICWVETTPWQKSWIHWASMERAVIDFHEQPEELQEYLEIQKRLHTRIAELAAESPCKFIDIGDNMTDTVSPEYYRNYCLPIYEIYSKQLEGTGKFLGIHMDGRLGNLKREIAETPCKVVESLTVPPAGDISLAEARNIWPDKTISMNCPPHLHWAEPEEVRKAYEALAEEWGSKKGLILTRSEPVPLEKIEAHLSAAMDAFGY